MGNEPTIKERWEALSDENKAAIKSLHTAAQSLVDGLDELAEAKAEATTPYAVKTINMLISNVSAQLEDVEFRLQGLWGFKQDSAYHTWWLKPKSCTCPKMDNADPAFYGGGKIINGDCPIHNLTKQEVKDE